MIARGAPVPLPDPPLADGALVLRPWRLADAPCLVQAWHDPEVVRWTGVPDRTDLEAAQRWISGDAHRRALGLALDLVIDVGGAVAGEVGLAGLEAGAGTVDIGWWVAADRRGAGLASRAARLVASWAVTELSVTAVVARCHPDNPASAAVAQAAGFHADLASGPDVWRFT